MKANEFVNRFGWEKAKEFSEITIKGLSQEYCFEINTGESIGLAYVNLDDLKRLVESWEYVQIHGLKKSKEIIKKAPADAECYSWTIGNSGIRDKTVLLSKLKDAIRNVESVGIEKT